MLGLGSENRNGLLDCRLSIHRFVSLQAVCISPCLLAGYAYVTLLAFRLSLYFLVSLQAVCNVHCLLLAYRLSLYRLLLARKVSVYDLLLACNFYIALFFTNEETLYCRVLTVACLHDCQGSVMMHIHGCWGAGASQCLSEDSSVKFLCSQDSKFQMSSQWSLCSYLEIGTSCINSSQENWLFTRGWRYSPVSEMSF
jgi:hypothetical protein